MGFVDRWGRDHDDLRISVTDRCNLRCNYCMPEEPAWFPRAQMLTYEEIARIARVCAGRGVRSFRLTGGEPLLRRDLPRLVAMLAAIPGIEDLSLTTNAILLDRAAPELAAAGLKRINVSLDTLDRERYARLTARDELDRVLRGIEAAGACGLRPIKINTVLLRGVNDDEVESLVETAREREWELRFIEFMPLENGQSWDMSRVVSGTEVRRRIEARWALEPCGEADKSAPAHRYAFEDGRGAVGFIDSVTSPFCSTCSRIRLTADGLLRVCLYDDGEVDLKGPIRAGVDDRALERLIASAVLRKGRGGAIEILENRSAIPLRRTMHQIGG